MSVMICLSILHLYCFLLFLQAKTAIPDEPVFVLTVVPLGLVYAGQAGVHSNYSFIVQTCVINFLTKCLSNYSM
jgi:hypothetical protein